MACFDPDALYQTASFRGIEFPCLVSDDQFGQRGPLHLYPDRQTPYNEFTGRLPHLHRIDGLFHGETHVAQYRALVAAVDIPSPGPLVHPSLGRVMVKIRTMNATHRYEEQAAITEFTLDCEEAGDKLTPGGIVAFGAAVVARAGIVASEIVAGATRLLDYSGLPTYLTEESIAPAVEAVTAIRSAMRGSVIWTTEAARAHDRLIEFERSPYPSAPHVASLITGALNVIGDDYGNRRRAFDALGGIAAFLPSYQGTSSQAAGAAKVIDNINATIAVTRVAAVSQMARVALEDDRFFRSYTEASDWRGHMFALLNQEQMIAAQRTDAELYRTVGLLYRDVAAAVLDLAPRLPTRRIVNVCAEMPSLAASWRLQGKSANPLSVERANGSRSTWFLPRTVEIVS